MVKGIKTSEFWLTLAAMVVGTLKATYFPDLPDEALLAVVAYVLSRTGLKVADVLKPK